MQCVGESSNISLIGEKTDANKAENCFRLDTEPMTHISIVVYIHYRNSLTLSKFYSSFTSQINEAISNKTTLYIAYVR